jgi:hypothetical protein
MKARILRVVSVATVVVLIGTLVMLTLPARPASAERPSGERLRDKIQSILNGVDLGWRFRNEASLPITVAGFPPGTNITRYEQKLLDIGLGPDGVPKGVFEGAEPASIDGKPMQIFVPTEKMTMVYAWDPKNGYKFIDMAFPIFFKTDEVWIDYNKPFATAKWELQAARTAATQTADYSLMLEIDSIEQQLKNLGYQTGTTAADVKANLEAAIPPGLVDAAAALNTASAHMSQATAQLKAELDAQLKSAATAKAQGAEASQLGANAKQLSDTADQLNKAAALLNDQINVQLKLGATSNLTGTNASQLAASAIQLEDTAARLDQITADLKALRAAATK